MKRVKGPFKTEAEAQAFQEGVEFVNDSAIENLEIVQRKSGWYVTMTDSDYENEADEELPAE